MDLHAEMRDIANAVLARHAEKQRQLAAQVQRPVLAPNAPTVEQLRAELAEARAGFDPAYQYSDDHGYWARQHEKAQRISSIEQQIAAREAAL